MVTRTGNSRQTLFSVRQQAVILFLFFVTLSYSGYSQLKLQPVQRKYATPATVRKDHPAARTQAVLSLPFWDDFSFTPVDDPKDTTANYPLTDLWVDSYSTWISSAIGLNAPTRNVASFDALDSAGRPYSNETLQTGYADQLVSQPINMASVADQNTVFLSFFYQSQGNGEPPDPKDYLQLDVRNESKQWETLMTIRPRESHDPGVFYDTIVQIAGNRFFHDSLQFRFRNFGRLSGPFDSWNIDYVYLNDNRSANDLSFPDRAVASTISPLFGRYTAIPIQHFFENKILSEVEFDVKNLKNAASLISVDYELRGKFINYDDGSANEVEALVVTGGVRTPTNGIMEPLERLRVHTHILPDTNLFLPGADSIDVVYTAHVLSNDNDDVDAPDFAPLDFRINDTTSARFHLNNYYAYDDGSAEFSAILTQAGNRAAVAFDLATSQKDTLAGFDIYIPPFGLSGITTADFAIYQDSAGVPKQIYLIASRTIQRLRINEFQRIRIQLEEAVSVSGRFYIGWKAPVSGVLPVGVDYSNNTSDRIFEFVDGQWRTADAIKGSLMIRPLFGKGVNGPVTGIPEPLAGISVYPNPSRGEFHIEGNAMIMGITSITGQPVPFTVEHHHAEQKTIILRDASPGMYLLKLRQGRHLGTKKIIIY